MAPAAHQRTPVYDAIARHKPLHPGKVYFGVLDLETIHHMFYEAAFWRVQAMNSHIVSADAFDHDWHTTIMFGLVKGLGGQPAADMLHRWGQTQTVENGPPSRLAHLTTVLGRQMCDRYWELMHTQGMAAAQGYASAVEVSRGRARDQVLALYQSATRHDMDLARQAENTRKTFSAILTVAEMSMVIVGCVITLGIGGPVIIGASSAAAGGWTFGTSLVYGIAATCAKGKPGVWSAVAVKTAQTVGKKGVSLGMTKLRDIAKAHVANQETGFEGAVAKVHQLSKQYAFMRPAGRLAEKAAANPASTQALQNSLKRVEFVKGGMPIVFAAVNLKTIWDDGLKRWNDDGTHP